MRLKWAVIGAVITFGGLLGLYGSYVESRGYPQKRSVEVVQVGKGYTVICLEDRNPYPFHEQVAPDVHAVIGIVHQCLTMKVRPDWRE